MMKHLLIIGLLTLMMPLSAETLNICKTFEKLRANANDFSPLMVEDKDNPITNTSTIQLEGAESSSFNKFGTVKFNAELGSFKTKKEASDKQNEWKNALKACYPGLNYSVENKDVLGLAEYTYSYIFIKTATIIRLYEACFCISKTTSDYDLTLEYPQVQKKGLLAEEIPAYTDYNLITKEPEESLFASNLSLILVQAENDFKQITGDLSLEDVSEEALTYDAKIKLIGYPSCYIETDLREEMSYVVNLCSDVDRVTYEKTMETFVKQLMSALGNKYAYRTSASGSSVSFVSVENPGKTVASVYFSEKNGKFSANFTVYAI